MSSDSTKFGFGGVLIALGIVFGDIGTSPLYVFQAITGGKNFEPTIVLGGLSAIIWTLLLIATIKYIYFALNADNHGEGGIFALFALLKKKKMKWIIYPALIGCATLMADGFLTPAISISSAVEGLKNINPNIPVLPIVVGIVIALFFIQQFGTQLIGKAFGPVMVIWFILLAVLGIMNIGDQLPTLLKAFNPMYAVHLITDSERGFWILGSVFLCTTGAEALYSDLGHCGKKNIRLSWSIVGVVLIVHYFGQAAICLRGEVRPNTSVFYSMINVEYLPYVVVLATIATVIASQALITGVFTLINEAIKLKLWTNMKVKYPTNHKGQIYIPFINYFLMFGCLGIIYYFKESSAMEHAYGLAITINMVMTSILLGLLLTKKYPKFKYFYIGIIGVFLFVETLFLASSLGKFKDGGFVTFGIALLLFILLYHYYKAKELRKSISEYISMKKVIPLLNAVSSDTTIPYESTNLVYPIRSGDATKLDATVYYSLFKKKPRKAGVYWFLHIIDTTEPWGVHYAVEPIIEGKCYFVSLSMGFKEEHRIEYMMKKIQHKMVLKGELSGKSVFPSVMDHDFEADFKFIVLNSRVATDNQLTTWQMISVKIYRFIKSIGLSAAEDFGLDKTNVTEEFIPINVTKRVRTHLIDDGAVTATP
jgi:KUP system potassium uptake protein